MKRRDPWALTDKRDIADDERDRAWMEGFAFGVGAVLFLECMGGLVIAIISLVQQIVDLFA